jgi:hypothetical protein
MKWSHMYNPLILLMLRSPLHGMVSHALLALEFEGRKSGNTVRVPVEYVRDGDTLWILSQASRTWWKNLQVEVPITIWLRGHPVRAMAKACAGQPESFRHALAVYLKRYPKRLKYFGIEQLPDGALDEDSFLVVTRRMVTIRIRLGTVRAAAH